MTIILANKVAKYIQRLDKTTAARIKTALKGLGNDPPDGDIKKLTGKRAEYRLRIGSYRAVFEYSENVIQVTDLDTRGQIYKK
ncbi:hypothetical protein FACS18949_07650 [Clostridia bacterium]|nr:hypothetical protein FACS18949_07650 [Clostridia bacterium]